MRVETHGSSLDLDDDAFLDMFERGIIGAQDFPHRAHVRMAWLYVQRFGAEEAGERAARGITVLAASHGHPTLYHDTLTRAWVQIVAVAVSTSRVTEFDGLIAEHPELLDKSLPLRHYSPERLWSQEARDRFVPPDVREFPRHGAPA
jgi:hypothetical protein